MNPSPRLETLPFPTHLPTIDPLSPTGVWDPNWKKPEVARFVATYAYRDLRNQLGDFEALELIAAAKLPNLAGERTDERQFPLTETSQLPEFKEQFRGGSFGEIFRQYTSAPPQVPQYFHAQGVMFGVDSDGRFFLRAIVGRLNGNDLGNKAMLQLAFLDKAKAPIGGIAWSGQLDLQPEQRVLIAGKSATLAAAFRKIDSARVSFQTQPAP